MDASGTECKRAYPFAPHEPRLIYFPSDIATFAMAGHSPDARICANRLFSKMADSLWHTRVNNPVALSSDKAAACDAPRPEGSVAEG